MDAKTYAQYEAKARIVKAMAHPSRLLIVHELSKHGSLCVCDITALVGTEASTVSRHLNQLKNAGIVTDRRAGNRVFYDLRVNCLRGFFSCIEQVMQSNAADQANLLA